MSTWHSTDRGQVWRTYIESSLLMQTRLDEDLRSATGLSLMDYHVLLLLSEVPGRRLRMGDLAERMVFSPSRLTYQVKSMEQRGLVLRQASSEDGRVHHAVLTAAGLEALREAGTHHADTVRALFLDDLSEAEVQVLGAVFTRLRSRMTTDSASTQAPGPRGDTHALSS